ncbi:hypothetical protein ACFX15_010368 [Malus domestica]
MYLTEISNFPSLLPFRGAKKHSIPSNLDLISSSFDDAVLHHLKSLGPPFISLSWLSKAVDFVALTHSEVRNLISNLKVAPSLDDSLTWYLDHSVKDSEKEAMDDSSAITMSRSGVPHGCQCFFPIPTLVQGAHAWQLRDIKRGK